MLFHLQFHITNPSSKRSWKLGIFEFNLLAYISDFWSEQITYYTKNSFLKFYLTNLCSEIFYTYEHLMWISI